MATHAHGRELEVRAQLRSVFPGLGASVADEAVEYALRNAEESAEESKENDNGQEEARGNRACNTSSSEFPLSGNWKDL